MNKKYLVVDLGSTNIKIDQFDQEFNLEKSSKFSTNLKSQNQKIDLDYLCQKLKEKFLRLNQEKEQYIVLFVAAMHSLIVTSEENEILMSSNLKFDAHQGLETFTSHQLQEIRKINGMIIGSHLPIFRLVEQQKKWFLTNQKVQTVFSLKSYLLKQFTGQNVTDLSDASGFGMLDYQKKEWSEKLVNLTSLEINQLPKIIPPQQLLNSQFENLQFSVGLADGAGASIFVNHLDSEALSISIGTTIGVRKIMKTLPNLQSDFDYLIPLPNNEYVYGISFNNGANNLSDFLNQQSFDFQVVESALKLEDENTDFYLPFAWKERNIFLWNKKTNLESLLKKHSPEIIIKKIVQSISFLAKWMVQTLALGGSNQKIIVTGGFFDNDTINQFFTDCLGTKISLIKNENLSTKGAYLNLVNFSEERPLKIQIYTPQKNYQKIYYQWEKIIWSPEDEKWKMF